MAEINNNPNKGFSLMNIKSNYILKEIFDVLDISKCLNIIRYSKIYQQKLEKDINNYKDEYLNIEIEIIPSEGNLITFIEDWDKKGYFHYFINDNKEELKRNYILKMDNAKKIKVKVDKEVKSFSRLFQDCVNNKKIKFVKFNRKDIEDMSYMFQGCLSLEELDISKMKTNNVKNMEYMFDRCESLKKLNFSNFKTYNVSEMIFMFVKCRKLKEI